MTMIMTPTIFHCNWNWCRATFTNESDFKHHFRIQHATSIAFVKGKDWDNWLQAHTGQGSNSDSLFDAVPPQSLSIDRHDSYQLNGHSSTSISSVPHVQDDHTPSPEPSSPPRQGFSDYVAQSSPSPPIGSMSPSPQLSDMIADATKSRTRPSLSPLDDEDEAEAGPSMPHIRQRPSSSVNSHASANSVIDVETQLQLGSPANSSFGGSAQNSQSVDNHVSVEEDPSQSQSTSHLHLDYSEPSPPPPSPPRLRRSSRARSKTPLPALPPPVNGRRSRANSASKSKPNSLAESKPNSRQRTPARSRASSAEPSQRSKSKRQNAKLLAIPEPPIECIHEDEEPQESGNFIQHPILGEVQVLGTRTGSFQLKGSSPPVAITSQEVDELADDTTSEASYSALLDPDYGYRYSQFTLQTQAPYHSQSQSQSQ